MLSRRKSCCALAAAVVALALAGLLSPPPRSSDPLVAELGDRFETLVDATANISVSSKGVLKRDRDTFFWSLFSDKFGSNPNTPYMWNALPLLGFLLPSPMWNLRRHDAVVLISRLPPKVEYFSFTTFALFVPGRGLPFSSLGDSINNLNIKHSESGLFAHVVTCNKLTFDMVRQVLVKSGLPESAINLAIVPSDLGLFETWTHFETVMRIFRFDNQTEGNAYLKSHHPVFYLRSWHEDEGVFPTQGYKDRSHANNVKEAAFEADFVTHGNATLLKCEEAFDVRMPTLQSVRFAALMIQGLDCLKNHTDCLGDCPDAAYFGPYVREDSDDIQMLKLPTENEFHLVIVVNHRWLNASIYGSIAVLKGASPATATLSRSHMKVFATPIGITSFEFPSSKKFVSWVFTRNADHCAQLASTTAVDGCSLIPDTEVSRDGHFTYCERIYLNPVTGTGPNWADILPAQLYHVDLATAVSIRIEHALPSGLPVSLPVSFFPSKPFRFLHIIKTGGESLENYLSSQPMPRLDFSTCRRIALSLGSRLNMSVSLPCWAAASGVSSALCGLNCECCAADIRLPSEGFHGTLLRSPRAHVLSLFSHGHTAHHTSLGRIASDVSLFLAESILRGTEAVCNSSNFGSSADWNTALREQLGADPEDNARPLRVLPMDNTQAHALTCSKSRGSVGHHFRVAGVDSLRPDLKSALKALHQFEWIGLTDLFEPSLCLLHYQANGSIPDSCNCDTPNRSHLWTWAETRSERRSPHLLSSDVLAEIDARTTVDAALFAEAVRLLLGRLRKMEELTGVSLLRCIDWNKLWNDTKYIPGLWSGRGEFAPQQSHEVG